MTILDLIKKSAVMLNIQEVLNDNELDGINASNEQTCLDNNFALKRLFEFTKIVLNEISSHLPKIVEVKCNAVGNKIELGTLNRMSKIVSVKNQGMYVKYSVVDNSIKVAQDGEYVVSYKQYPQVDSVLDEVDIYSEYLGEDIFVYGLNAYYCLASGLFSEFNVYNAHYSERLNDLKDLKLFSMPRRRWV